MDEQLKNSDAFIVSQLDTEMPIPKPNDLIQRSKQEKKNTAATHLFLIVGNKVSDVVLVELKPPVVAAPRIRIWIARKHFKRHVTKEAIKSKQRRIKRSGLNCRHKIGQQRINSVSITPTQLVVVRKIGFWRQLSTVVLEQARVDALLAELRHNPLRQRDQKTVFPSF